MYQVLISVSKFPIKKEIRYSINFKSFTSGDSIFEVAPQTYQVAGQNLENCYKINHGYPERIENPDDIEFLYWTIKYGLTAYTSKSGETWFLINLKSALFYPLRRGLCLRRHINNQKSQLYRVESGAKATSRARRSGITNRKPVLGTILLLRHNPDTSGQRPIFQFLNSSFPQIVSKKTYEVVNKH